MNSNTKQLLEALPDISEFLKIAEEIGIFSYEKMIVEKEIKEAEANVVRHCFSNEEFFQGGRPPSMSYIDSTYKYTGINNEILPLREKLAELTSSLERRKLTLSVYKDMLEVWRTLSANERNATL